MSLDKNTAIDNAHRYIQKDQFKKAIREYDKILVADPTDIRTLHRKAELLAKTGDREGAITNYLAVADSYSKQGFNLKAVAVLKQILRLEPDSIEVMLKLADEYQRLGLAGDAFSHLLMAVSFYEQRGMIQECMAPMEKMVDLDPGNVPNRIKLAELQVKCQNLAGALLNFSASADVLKAENRMEDFVRVAERMVFIDPTNISLLKELGSLHLLAGDTKRALQRLQIAFRSDPRDIETLSLLADGFIKLGQPSKSLMVLKEMAKILEESGTREELRIVYERILAIAPDDVEAHQAMQHPVSRTAEIEITAGDPETTDELQRRVVFDEPLQQTQEDPPNRGGDDNQKIARLMTETDIYLKYGLTQKALAHLSCILQIEPENTEAKRKLKEIESGHDVPDGGQDGEPCSPVTVYSEDEILEIDFEEEISQDNSVEVSQEPSAITEDESEGLEQVFQYSVEDVLDEFKKGLSKVIAKEDFSTHFDLGTAFREMGLLDDAVAQFEIASQDAKHRLSALLMIGLCLLDQKREQEAICRFKIALLHPEINTQEAQAAAYELGHAYELIDDKEAAFYFYKRVYLLNSKFRDVATRLNALRSFKKRR